MEQFKRAQVIILLTNKLSSIILSITDKKLKLNGRDKFLAGNYQHLYIISDDEIKEKSLLNTNDYYYIKNHYNEWYIGKFNGVSFDFINNQGNFDSNLFIAKKIIATTDTSLNIKCSKDCTNYITESCNNLCYNSNLPQPSQQFIEKYIESYNKGEVITDVLVEYYNPYEKLVGNKIGSNIGDFELTKENSCKLKVNPKDNTITIKKLKDSWNKEEVIKLINNFNEDVPSILKTSSDKILTTDTLNKWIKENL